MLPGLSELGKRYPNLARGVCQFAGIKLSAKEFQLDAAAAPCTPAGVICKCVFQDCGHHTGVCPCPLPHTPSRAGHCQPPQHRASSASQSCTQNSPLGWQMSSLFSHISLFPFFFPDWAPPLPSSRDRTQSSNSGTHIGQASFCAALWVELLMLLIN